MSSIDFNSLLSKPLDDVKRPAPLPPGTYFGNIIQWEMGESRERKTPYIRFHLQFTEAGPDIDADELQKEGIDLSKRKMTRDFYLTADAEYRLKEFIASLDIATQGRSFSETLPETIGAQVQMTVTQRPDNRDPEAPPRNDIDKVSGRKD